MFRKEYTEEQIITMLREAEVGAKVADLCRKQGVRTSDLPLSELDKLWNEAKKRAG